MNIKINDRMRVTTDSMNYILQKRVKNKKGGWTWYNEGYYPDWDSLTEDLLNLKIRESDAKTLREVRDIIKEQKNAVSSSQSL